MGSIDYHLSELEIAFDENDERRILPDVLDSEKIILDIGCGIGQSFVALARTDRICVGLDVDADAIRYGIEHFGDRIQFILADATRIPLPSRTFDLVYSRVALPYTNVPKAVREIRRVLRTGGRVWMTLHDRDRTLRSFAEARAARNVRRMIHTAYVLMNGLLLKHCAAVVPFVTGRYESWQDTAAMKGLLTGAGFEVDVKRIGRHTVIEGRLREPRTD